MIKFYHQLEMTDCGPTCIRMVASHYGKKIGLNELREYCNITRVGVSLGDIVYGCEAIGLKTLPLKLTIEELINEQLPFPCILHWRQEHFVVLTKIKIKKNKTLFYILDPGFGKLKLDQSEFEKFWNDRNEKGILLAIEKTDEFEKYIPLNEDSQWKRSWGFLKKHLKSHRSALLKISLLLLLASALSFVFPLTVQYMIDKGIAIKNLNAIWVVVFFQAFLLIGQLLSEWIRSILLIHLGMNMSITIIKEFLHKIIKLPIKFFDTRLHTDILQRIEDQEQIEKFITQISLQSIFSVFLLLALSIQLALYDFRIFGIFLVLSSFSISWTLIFFNKREKINYTKFNMFSNNRNTLIELITGMTEIKINNAQQVKVGLWEKIQEKLYELQLKELKLNQYQLIGVKAFSNITNLVTTFLCASWVINDRMTLGVMLGIGYILGQLNAPIQQLLIFFRSAQDAKISFDRMDEIQKKENESNSDLIEAPIITNSISLQHVSFKYEPKSKTSVLNNISMNIPKGSITAIVGVSGSGKSTLMKLLLDFYEPSKGEITLDDINMKRVDPDSWRNQCGVVMQEGYIFSGSIMDNIAVAEEIPDAKRLDFASKTACINTFIATLPMGYNTKIGEAGIGLSGGQIQRLLIARAVYKNPEFLFFDEATSALDANNERAIMENLNLFFKGKTVVVIAHRLSTVKNADQIIVLDEGKITEQGEHEYLANQKGVYYNLVKNQLELGN